ncbi:MAG: PHP domain-containing protein [candidate division KSB1 bacterium]|nr:PHP domain-containing protein [candidate division KSB1 bacterium]
MALKLKVDLHLHTADDLAEIVAGRKHLIPPKTLVDMAVEQQFDAIAITHHGVPYSNSELSEYAQQKGILLIPGVETFIKKKHVLLLNFSARKHILTFQDLQRYKTEDVLVIAPHPYYVVGECLGRDLERHIDCFDAIEYCHYYYKLLNPNQKALRVAQKYGLPMVGNSDAHLAFQFGRTYSYVYAEERSIPAIVQAIKQGRVEYVSEPIPLTTFVRETFWLLEKLPYLVRVALRKLALRTSQPFLIRTFATPEVALASVKAQPVRTAPSYLNY